jgi:hypothetical protein
VKSRVHVEIVPAEAFALEALAFLAVGSRSAVAVIASAIQT